MGSDFTWATRLLWFSTVDGDQEGVCFSIQRSSSSDTVTMPASLPRCRVPDQGSQKTYPSSFFAITMRWIWLVPS